MAVVMSDDFASDREDVPVVLRLKQFGSTSAPTRTKVTRSGAGFRIRTDQLIALSATPLLALVIYIGWQLTATPSVPTASAQPVATEPPAIRIESVPETMPREHSHSPTTTPSRTPTDGIYLPTGDAAGFQPTQGARPAGEVSEIRSAECWCNESTVPGSKGQNVDPNVIRIRSVEAVSSRPEIHGRMRAIPAPPE